MLFHTWVFLVFFLIVYPVYLLVRRNNQLMNIWLMIASYTFYGWWNPWYLLLLFGTSAIDYLMVCLMERSTRARASSGSSSAWSAISAFWATSNTPASSPKTSIRFLAHLGFVGDLPDPAAYPNAMLSLVGVPEDRFFTEVILPIGISFHTFQSMSYTIDAYKGVIKTERSFVRFLTFVSFFPAVGGRADRARTQPSAAAAANADASRGKTSPMACRCFSSASSRRWRWPITWPSMSTRSTATPASSRRRRLFLATVAFGWQIYFDFSGYTDMARGIALLMGFRMMLNFNNPYTATGLGDFWNRWHISLSTWFKDYLYFPLGGSRHGKLRTYLNMFITMVISGIWHGAAWTFVIWGGLHALGRCLTRELEQTEFYQERMPRLVKQLAVFTFVTFTWIFFRAQSLTDAWLIISRIFTTGWADPRFPLVMAVLILAVWCTSFCTPAGRRCDGGSKCSRCEWAWPRS